MNDFTDMVGATINPTPITFESIKAAIDKLREKPQLPEGNPLFGIIEIKENAMLKGTETIVVSGDKAYFWPDIFDSEKVNILKIPEHNIELDLSLINEPDKPDTLQMRINARMFNFR